MNETQKIYTKRNKILRNKGYANYQEFLKSETWKTIKLKIDDSKKFCHCCGTNSSLDAHHTSYRNNMVNEEKGMRNVKFMCRKCHEEIHSIQRNSNVWISEAERILRKRNNFSISKHYFKRKISKGTDVVEALGIGKISTKKTWVAQCVGGNCKKCNIPMVRKKSLKENPYYGYWDVCLACGVVQHYKEAITKKKKGLLDY